jgi:hypothetical protein
MIIKTQGNKNKIKQFIFALTIMMGLIYFFWPKIGESSDTKIPIEESNQGQSIVNEDFIQKDSLITLINRLCINHSTNHRVENLNGQLKITIHPIRNKVVFLGKDYNRFDNYKGTDCSTEIKADSIILISDIKKEAGSEYLAIPIDILYALLLNNKTAGN